MAKGMVVVPKSVWEVALVEVDLGDVSEASASGPVFFDLDGMG